MRKLRLSSGEKITMPNVIRKVTRSTMVKQYLQFCEEEQFEPLSRSTLFRILEVREASQQKSLSNLDNTAADGSAGFAKLLRIVDEIDKFMLAKNVVDELRKALSKGKRYLKTQFQSHCQEDESECPDHCHWAMKLLQLRYREKQSDWYGKRGLTWHISRVVSPSQSNTTEFISYAHLFDQCTQDWYAVTSILEDLLKQLKVKNPLLQKVHLRSDEAGCYHNSSLVTAVRDVAKGVGVEVHSYHYSEPQSGKDICDHTAGIECSSCSSDSSIPLTSPGDTSPLSPLRTGWAVSKPRGSVRFSENVKEYLTARFTLGERTGRKADPAQVAVDMRNAKNESNARLFTREQWLTKSQVQSFFSRLAPMRRKDQGVIGISLDEQEDVQSVQENSERLDLVDKVNKENKVLHPMCYDSLCLSVSFPDIVPPGPGYWKLNTSILDDLDHCQLVWDEWSAWCLAVPAFFLWLNGGVRGKVGSGERWGQGKSRIKGLPIRFCDKARRTSPSRDALVRLVQHLQEKVDAGITPCQDPLRSAMSELARLDSHTAREAQVRARVRLVQENESSSLYFLRLEKKRSDDRHISALREPDGSVVSSSAAIRASLSSFYYGLYTASPTESHVQSSLLGNLSFVLPQDQANTCEGPLTPSEVLHALKGMARNKAPGLDGLPMEFYLRFWDVVGADLESVLNDCSFSGSLSLSKHRCDHSVFQEGGPPGSQELAAHISSQRRLQTCGDPGRFIGENLALLRDAVSYAESSGTPVAISSLDQEKAFDQVDWGFMRSTLVAMGFGPSFVTWVDLFYSQGDFVDVNISTRVIVLYIAVRVKYGISQSRGIVVFVLAPCHSRNMPQCVEIFEVRVKYGISQSPGIVVFVLAPCHSRNMPQCVEIFEEANLDRGGLQDSIGRAQALCSAMRDEWKKLDDWQKQRKSQELQYQALQSSPSSNTNTATSSQGTSSNNIVKNQDKTSALQSSPSSNTNTASSSQGTSSNNIVNNQDKTSAIQSSPSSNTNTANSSQGTCSNNTITVNSQDKTSNTEEMTTLELSLAATTQRHKQNAPPPASSDEELSVPSKPFVLTQSPSPETSQSASNSTNTTPLAENSPISSVDNASPPTPPENHTAAPTSNLKAFLDPIKRAAPNRKLFFASVPGPFSTDAGPTLCITSMEIIRSTKGHKFKISPATQELWHKLYDTVQHDAFALLFALHHKAQKVNKIFLEQ
ncbi:Transposon TX1 uncharacterized 149 kDa protein [Stylophora pistillata]|uniref:Transposon TX1 uncharacterized 149 kDa protein n=1 Tax=Stylophora pistillata TaxID=50429 RepID=A0A2B4RLX7_STYPI|nr:Transposon TX1 uncharacterized 149 kDa protein [Stylophora pistillata]